MFSHGGGGEGERGGRGEGGGEGREEGCMCVFAKCFMKRLYQSSSLEQVFFGKF